MIDLHHPTMKRFVTFVRKILPQESAKPLGRWNRESSYVKIKQKVDLSNEDHCGPCGQYSLTKLEEEKTKQKVIEKVQSI